MRELDSTFLDKPSMTSCVDDPKDKAMKLSMLLFYIYLYKVLKRSLFQYHTIFLLSSAKRNIMENNTKLTYEDLLPVMADKLDVEAFVGELCKGFRLLADPERRLITAESLRRNSALLGMEGMSKDDAEAMVTEGDLDGDGVLNETEFCILMVRLSPEMMEDAEAWLQKALDQELKKSST